MLLYLYTHFPMTEIIPFLDCLGEKKQLLILQFTSLKLRYGHDVANLSRWESLSPLSLCTIVWYTYCWSLLPSYFSVYSLPGANMSSTQQIHFVCLWPVPPMPCRTKTLAPYFPQAEIGVTSPIPSCCNASAFALSPNSSLKSTLFFF